MAFIGLDYGRTRIGIAVSNPQNTWSIPSGFLRKIPFEKFIKELKEIIKDRCVDTVVVGMPYREDGTLTDMGSEITEFAEKIGNMLNVTVVTWNERYTTKEAHEILRAMKTRRKARNKKVDALAASLMLQSYLDRRNRC